jgi:hypothetical protein
MTIEPGRTEDPDPQTSPTPAAEPTVVYVREPAGRRWSRRLLVLVGTLVVIVALVFGLKAVNLWPELRNPFATEETDRTGPVLLQSIQDLSRYVAAEGNFQVLVDLQENNRFIPNFLFNERILFVGVGTVEAYVDFSAVSDGAVVVSPDGKSVEIKLPAPTLGKPSLDTGRSHVFAQERGIANRISDLIKSDPNEQRDVYQRAEQDISAAAEQSELKERAKKNTTLMLESLFKSLGYERVTVTYTEP